MWDVEKDEWVKGFGGHKDSVSVCMSYVHNVYNANIVFVPFRALHSGKVHNNCTLAHLIGLSSYSISQ